MTDTLTLTGLVATTPRHLVTSEGCLVLLVACQHGSHLRETESRPRR
jgi:hypothetical protein